MTDQKTQDAYMRVPLERKVSLRLTKSELELLYVEMRSAIDNGAEDSGFAAILAKTLAALNNLRANVEVTGAAALCRVQRSETERC